MLIWEHRDQQMFQKILVPLDMSPLSEWVFEQAIELASSSQAHLMLLHVLSTDEENTPDFGTLVGMSYYPTVDGEFFANYQKQWQTFSQNSLETLQSRCQRATDAGIQTEYTQTFGKPGQTICALAKTWSADLIVMGRRGYSAFGEMILGSVSHYVVHHGSCSVLIVQS